MKATVITFILAFIFIIAGIVATISGFIILADNGTAWPYLTFGPLAIIGGMAFWMRKIFNIMPKTLIDELDDVFTLD